MVELVIVLTVVGALVAATMIGWTSLLVAGALATALGLLVGVPTGFWYHVVLGQALAAGNADSPRWWLRPAAFHDRLDADGRRRVMPWFYAGGAGFVVTVVGLALLGLGVLLGYSRLS